MGSVLTQVFWHTAAVVAAMVFIPGVYEMYQTAGHALAGGIKGAFNMSAAGSAKTVLDFAPIL